MPYGKRTCISENTDHEQKVAAEGVRWYEASAKNGAPHAQYDLACCYAKGEGVKRDMNKALFWCHLAAMSGDKDALKMLQELE